MFPLQIQDKMFIISLKMIKNRKNKTQRLLISIKQQKNRYEYGSDTCI